MSFTVSRVRNALLIFSHNADVLRCVVSAHRARKLPFALKVIETSKVKGQEQFKVIENEVAILRRLKNRNIVQLIEEFHTPSATFLVMELVTVCAYVTVTTSVTKKTENLSISAILPGHYTVVSDCFRHGGPSSYFLL